MDPYYTLLMSVFLLPMKFSIEDGERCKSPQYIELDKPGIITCSLENAYAVSWYNSTVLTNEYPIVHYSASAKSGSGYISGEFDISRDGSLIINNVSFRHDHFFAVEYLNAKLDDAVVLNIQVIVVVKPSFPFPVIEYCKTVTGLCFQKIEDPHVSCMVKNIRPVAHLELTVETVNGSKNISFRPYTESNGKLFTSRVTTTDPFKYTSRLALISCTAHTLPEILERNEQIVLLQNNQSVHNIDPTVMFIERNSSLELRCSGPEIGFLVWWMADTPNTTQLGHLLAYAVLLGNPQQKIHMQGYQIGREGSVIVPQFDMNYEGTYSCISSDGLRDTVTVYETIMFVKPLPNHLMVDGCNYKQNCVLEVMNEGNLSCRVNGVRPPVQLQWKAFHGEKSISFKTQQVLIVGRNDTYDVSLTSAYNAKVEPGDKVTVVCQVVGPYADLFNMSTTLELNFWKEAAFNPSTITTPLQKGRSIPTIVVVLVLIIAVFLCVVLMIKRKKVIDIVCCRKQGDVTHGGKIFSLLPVKASQDGHLKEIKQQLIIYLEDQNQCLLHKVQNLEDTSEELLEVLRQLCFRGIQIRGDEDRQESAIKLLNIARDYKINIRKVLLRDCFRDIRDSSIITTSDQALPSTIPISQLDISSLSQMLEDRDYYLVKQILCYASQCGKLRLLTFSHCVLPYSFDDSSDLVQLQNNNVEVCWENGIFLPKFVLDLSSGKWKYAVDGCELQHGDYQNLTSCISEKKSLTVDSKIRERTINYSAKQMVLAQRIFHTMEKCFKLHGAVTIDTPMFEMRETIAETFGPHYAKAMFDINDQGDESISLRFDLTIPFVRYITSNNISELKRYHIGKVFRRDNLFKTGWRRGEFYKCDFDIAGKHERMLPDAECIKIACTVLSELTTEEIIVKINHQKILTGLSKLLNVQKDTIEGISEFLEITPNATEYDIVQHIRNKQHVNISDQQAKRILHYLGIKGGKNKIEALLKDNDLFAHSENADEKMEIDIARKEYCEGLEDLKLLYEFCEIMGVAYKVRFEMGFTLSLRFYTGLCFQAALTGPKLSLSVPSKRSGILANGGRFDKFPGKVSGEKETVPCVGFTFDIGQLLTLLEYHVDNTGEVVRITATEVMVCSNRPNMSKEILKLCTDLWNAGVKAEIANKHYQDILDQWNKEEIMCIPFVACLTDVGNVVFATPGKPQVEETTVEKGQFVSQIKKLLEDCKKPGSRYFQSMAQ